MYPAINETLQGTIVMARCVGVDPADIQHGLEVEWSTPEGDLRRERAACLKEVHAAAGDQVLLAPVGAEPEWVVIGTVGSQPHAVDMTPAILPASGFRLEQAVVAGEDRLCLRNAAGRPELEVRVVDGRTHLRFPTRDAVLECDGSFEVRAGDAIRMEGSRYELKVSQDARMEAGGGVEIEASRQDLRSRDGELRLQARKNLVLWGEFLLLNTRDEKPWTSKT